MSPHKRLTGALAGILIGTGSVAGFAPGPAVAAPAPARAATPPAAQAITLVTGDVVQLAPTGDGRVAATVRPGPGRAGMSFTTTETEDGLRVVPRDAVPLIADGRVDAELFDVQHLVDEGYGDAARPTLPLIVQSAPGARALSATPGTELPSLGAVAVRADKKQLADFWRTQAGAGTGSRTAPTGKIWLDGKVEPVLDRSTAQIGAPDAWRAGLDGAGVKVAVLDTGADQNHPDLAGRVLEARDFSGSETGTTDHFGHGTHVAATVAGSGAGSNGTRKGVAPGARLLIGKVLDDSGSGYESGIIAGMEWAAGAGAKVVNMSLGGGATDGTDPMSAAVDEISASTGTLFVVAAGNEGADYSVGTPGAAPAALTVGAVDRDDRMAEFSSRGPRFGDEGLKPEITAPGVGIVAARAAGTAMGSPVDELYTAANGTSMATPHVAGAAAVIAQQHPGWTGAQIKDELVSTARTQSETSVYAQGAGRVDLTRATSQTVSATGVADFGLHALDETPAQVERTVTYTNAGTAPVTLTLAKTVAAVSLSAATVTVPAGGRAGVTLTFDLATATPGQFSGWLTATGPAGVKVTTAIGGTLDKQRHLVTFKAVNRAGKPSAVPVLQVFGDEQRYDILNFLMEGEEKTFQVGEGDYLVDATIQDGGPADEQDNLITIPELKVDRDLTVVLDARTAKPIRIETPRPAEQQTVESYYVHRVTGTGRGIINGFMNFSTIQKINVTPTAKLRKGSYEFSSRWQLVAPLAQATVPGVSGELDVNPVVSSPLYDGTRRFDLVKGLGGKVRGKAVVVEGDNPDDTAQAAAAAGAALVLLVVPADRSAWQPWDPSSPRLPVPIALVPGGDGQRILARAAKPGASLTLTLTPNSPYLYDVFQVTKSQVPAAGIVHKVTAANSHRITASYPHNGGLDWIKEQRFAWRPYQTYSWNDTYRQVRTPSVREEWVSAGDSVWQHQVHHEFSWVSFGGSLLGGIEEDPVSYPKAGASTETWNKPVVRPATPGGYANTRDGNTLKLRVASYVDSSDRHHLIESTPTTLSRNGAEIATLDNGWQDVPVPAGNATYKLAMTTKRLSMDAADWQYGTSTATEWTFKSGAAGKLPLLQIGYDAPVTATGVTTKLPHLLGVEVPNARKVRVETSADEGKTWKTALTIGSTVIVPAGKGTVSLRVTASDQAGNSVTQTVIRAYGRA
ncbi:S8 family serine peptidase [Actinoplanes sp. TRM 88003]|uniref:S8 family serine peptidase n=1 Tax=Paractinoplanes aksuensis TaxID=2939490 RepID=A0ABT1DRU0_9ACTN|nr:S8 family serine peptidase [Actinoplanes aksuensis]MCO8272796.1 S8 family serine peptidase [Actinoplanes aksuensis]